MNERGKSTGAKRYENYPFAQENAADPNDSRYKEGIYVGYRWFNTFGMEPRYPFGYGLSYTDFSTRRGTKQERLEGL